MEFSDELYEKMATVFAGCYQSIDKSKAGQRSIYDYFASRILSAGFEKTVPAALDRLAKRCSICSFDMDTDIVADLEKNRKEVLRRMRNESVYLAVLSAKLSKQLKTVPKITISDFMKENFMKEKEE